MMAALTSVAFFSLTVPAGAEPTVFNYQRYVISLLSLHCDLASPPFIACDLASLPFIPCDLASY
jgi:hypothetical protein